MAPQFVMRRTANPKKNHTLYGAEVQEKYQREIFDFGLPMLRLRSAWCACRTIAD
jgi:hypothetical protein